MNLTVPLNSPASSGYIILMYLRIVTSRICLLACTLGAGHGHGAKESGTPIGNQVDLSA